MSHLAMDSYEKHSFLSQVYDIWTRDENSEWGDQMRALVRAYEMGEDYAGLSEEEMDALQAIIHAHVCSEEMRYDYLGDMLGGDRYYVSQTYKAVRDTLALQQPHKSKIGFAEELWALLPEWMKSTDWVDAYVAERPHLQDRRSGRDRRRPS